MGTEDLASCAACALLRADLAELATRWEGLADSFRATAGERAAIHTQLCGDGALALRRLLAAHPPTESCAA